MLFLYLYISINKDPLKMLRERKLIQKLLVRYMEMEAESNLGYKYWYTCLDEPETTFEVYSNMHTIGLRSRLPSHYAEVVMILFQCLWENDYTIIKNMHDSYAWEKNLKKRLFNYEFNGWIEAIETSFVICNGDVDCFEELPESEDASMEPVIYTIDQLIAMCDA
jgi:hypothetical protein